MRYVAFLRAINVGGRTVTMERLRTLFEGMGHSDVSTLIASGNVLFESRVRSASKLETTIEAGLREGLGYEVATFVRPAAEIPGIADHSMFQPAEVAAAHALYVGFLRGPLDDPSRARLAALGNANNTFADHGSTLYWLRRSREEKKPISPAQLERALDGPTTTRNINTLKRLAERLGEAGR